MRNMLIGIAAGCLVAAYKIQYGADLWAAFIEYVFLIILAVTALEDMSNRRIGDGCWMAVLLLVIISALTMKNMAVSERIAGMLCVSVPMFALTMLIPGSFGGGDIKLMFACGGFLGWKLITAASIFAVFLAGGYGIWLLAVKKKSRKSRFPFGPFLCLGMAAAQFVGTTFWEWLL